MSKSTLEAFLDHFILQVRSYTYNINRLEFSSLDLLVNDLRCLEPVHDRHIQIHQYAFIVAALLLGDHLDGPFSIIGVVRLYIEDLEHNTQGVQVVLIIIN